MAQQERNSQGGDRALRKARDREDTAPRFVQVAAARPGLGRAGMAPGNPWGGTKEHFLHWYSWVLPGQCPERGRGSGGAPGVWGTAEPGKGLCTKATVPPSRSRWEVRPDGNVMG